MTTETDRELLELAAKAAGYVVLQYVETEVHWGIDVQPPEGKPLYSWNPLADDGDALRLAVKLQLTVCNEHLNAGEAYCTNTDPLCSFGYKGVLTEHDSDDIAPSDYAATRRAIVLSAAEIGRAM